MELILDCDPGHDDAIAILRELREPDPSMAQVGDAATWQKMVHVALDQR